MDKYSLTIISFIAYFVSLISFCYYFTRKNRNKIKKTDDFLLADRSLNYWVTALSAQTSDMGSWLFLGYPAMIYQYGTQEIWTAIGLIFFMGLNWIFIAPKLRIDSDFFKADSIEEYLKNKLHINHNIAILYSLICLIFFTIYIAAGLVGIGKIFQCAFGIDLIWGTLAGILITLAYTIFGGFLAISWANLFQGIFLLLIIILVPALNFANLKNGFLDITNAANIKHINIENIFKFSSLNKLLKLGLSFGIGYFGQPHILINFMGIDDPKNLKKAGFVGISWQIIVLSAAIFAGLTGIAYCSNIEPEHLFVLLSQKVFNNFFVGLTLCAIMAATLSSINTQMLVASTSLSGSLTKYLHGRYKVINSTKISMILICIFSLFVANIFNTSLYSLVLYAWSGLGSSIGPVILMTLYWNKFNKTGVFYTLIVGALVSGFWPILGTTISPLIPGFISGFLAGILATLFSTKHA